MKLHRFYTGSQQKLEHDFWLHDPELLKQWNRVLRFRTGDEVVLFDGLQHERLYKIIELSLSEAHLQMITEFQPKHPKREVYLLWSSLKKDKNDWVLQKATELGVSHFWPLLADRSEKTGFNVDRAKKIVIEAAEQCGRSDIPSIREPLTIESALNEIRNKAAVYICEQQGGDAVEDTHAIAVLVGPEGGWSDSEKNIFKKDNLKHLDLHDFTLRAETAAVAAATIVTR